MAEPANFPESNGVRDTPQGVSPDDVAPLCVWAGDYPDGQPVVISCWKLTAEELAEVNRTGRVWLHILGRTMPPAYVGGAAPFQREEGGGA